MGTLTVEQLEKLIVGAVSLAGAAAKAEGHAATPEEMKRAAKGAAGSVLEGIKATDRIAARAADGWRSGG